MREDKKYFCKNMGKIERYNLEEALTEAEKIAKKANQFTGDNTEIKKEHYSEAEDAVSFDEGLKEQFISGNEATDFLKQDYERIAEAEAKKCSCDYANLNWDKFKEYLFIRKNEPRAFYSVIPLIEKNAHPDFKKLVEKIANDSLFIHGISGDGDGIVNNDIKTAAEYIEKSMFRSETGFYISLSYTARWHGHLIIYFNKQLIDLLKPSFESQRKIYSEAQQSKGGLEGTQGGPHVDSHYKTPVGSVNKGGRGIYLSKNVGFVNWTAGLLARKSKFFDGAESILGTVIHSKAEASPESRRGYPISIGPIDPVLLKALAYDDSDIVDGNRLAISDYYDPKKAEDYTALLPIQRITPDIVSGIIQYEYRDGIGLHDSGLFVKKIAVPENGKLKIYNPDMSEEKKDEAFDVLSKEDFMKLEFKKYLKDGDFRGINFLRTIAPEEFKEFENLNISKDDVQEGYEKAMMKTKLKEATAAVWEILLFTEITPNEKVLHELYQRLKESGQIDRWEWWARELGVDKNLFAGK